MAEFTISGDPKATSSSIRQLYQFLTDFQNFSSILPSDKVEDFVSEGDQCSFSIRGITRLTIRITQKIPFSLIEYSSQGLSKFNFVLRAEFTGTDDQPGSCSIALSGDLNPFILSMAEKPLRQLVTQMTEKLSQLVVPG